NTKYSLKKVLTTKNKELLAKIEKRNAALLNQTTQQEAEIITDPELIAKLHKAIADENLNFLEELRLQNKLSIFQLGCNEKDCDCTILIAAFDKPKVLNYFDKHFQFPLELVYNAIVDCDVGNIKTPADLFF